MILTANLLKNPIEVAKFVLDDESWNGKTTGQIKPFVIVEGVLAGILVLYLFAFLHVAMWILFIAPLFSVLYIFIGLRENRAKCAKKISAIIPEYEHNELHNRILRQALYLYQEEQDLITDPARQLRFYYIQALTVYKAKNKQIDKAFDSETPWCQQFLEINQEKFGQKIKFEWGTPPTQK